MADYAPCSCEKCVTIYNGEIVHADQTRRIRRQHERLHRRSSLLENKASFSNRSPAEPEIANDDTVMSEVDEAAVMEIDALAFVINRSLINVDQDDDVFRDDGPTGDAPGDSDSEDDGLFPAPDDSYLELEEVVPGGDSSSNLQSQFDPLYWFISLFLVHFQLLFLSESAAELLMRFINAVLGYFRSSLRLPSKLATLRGQVQIDANLQGMKRFVVCPKCHKLFNLDELLGAGHANPVATIQCDHREFPQRSPPCGTPLLRRAAGNRAVPIKEFAYNSLAHSLSVLFCRPDFSRQINLWKYRTQIPTTLFDVYDGQMWKDLGDKDGRQFALGDRSLLLTLNVDWFQPFDSGRQHSVGAIYMTVNNLPRSERFKPENVILVGVMPGPNEPSKHQINHYLHPLVNELCEFYEGKAIPTVDGDQLVRAALLMVACDIPAARKVSGFTGIGSICACYKCERQFPANPQNHLQRDFSGFTDVDSWVRRTGERNRMHAEEWRQAQTLDARTQLERQNGTQWSELHRLQYFDVVRCTVIDPMHNLFSGTAKRCMNVWKTLSDPHTGELLLNSRAFEEMAGNKGSVILPLGLDVAKGKIKGGCVGLTSDEWRTWVLALSPILLKGKIVGDHRALWVRFIEANRLLSKPSITTSEIDAAHEELRAFCGMYQDLYGATEVTPNMHLHMHLRETLLDFGPVYAFWLFGFERFNGLLKRTDTNGKDGFEVTFMRVFLKKYFASDYLRTATSSLREHESFMAVLRALIPALSNGAMVQPVNHANDFDLVQFVRFAEDIPAHEKPIGFEPLPSSVYASFEKAEYIKMNRDHYDLLFEYYDFFYEGIRPVFSPEDPSKKVVTDHVRKIKAIELLGETFRSQEAGRNQRSALIQAYFSDTGSSETYLRPGVVQYYFMHEVMLENHLDSTGKFMEFKHVFAFVRWFAQHPTQHTSYDDYGLKVWKAHYDPQDFTCILPVHRIHSLAGVSKWIDNNLVTIPLPRKTTG